MTDSLHVIDEIQSMETVPSSNQSNEILSCAVDASPSPSDSNVLRPANTNYSAEEDGKGICVKKKKSALFYPSPGLMATSNQAPYSRSAAKRDSIMALGSIGYLQHMYTKQGIASRRRPPIKGAVMAIGPAGETTLNASTDIDTCDHSSLELERTFDLPPSPQASTYKALSHPNSPDSIDVVSLKLALVKDLRTMLHLWDIEEWLYREDVHTPDLKLLLGEAAHAASRADHVNFAELHKSTTKAIRSVRSYFLALPNTSNFAGDSLNKKDHYRRQSSFSCVSIPVQSPSSDSTASRASAASRSTLWKPGESPFRDSDHDILGILRRSALAVLATLRDAEGKRCLTSQSQDSRVADNPLKSPELEPEQAQNPMDDSHSSIDLEYLMLGDQSHQPSRHFTESVALANLKAERLVVQQYLMTVDGLLSSVRRVHTRRIKKAASGVGIASEALEQSFDRISLNPIDAISTTLGSGLDQIIRAGEDQSRPTWLSKQYRKMDAGTRIKSFTMDHLALCQDTHAALRLSTIMSSATLEEVLHILADGQVLCELFNAAVANSERPWGFIQTRDIHDLRQEDAGDQQTTLENQKRVKEPVEPPVGLDTYVSFSNEDIQSNRPGWTFRRTENLRVWAAALKLRYSIKSTSAALPAVTKLASAHYGGRSASDSVQPEKPDHRETVIEFDPGAVVRTQKGWQNMLTQLITAWMDAVASETSSST